MNGAFLPQRPVWPPQPAAQPLGQGWVHESDLPLWMVKRYEEMSRHSAAMEAARVARLSMLLASLGLLQGCFVGPDEIGRCQEWQETNG